MATLDRKYLLFNVNEKIKIIKQKQLIMEA